MTPSATLFAPARSWVLGLRGYVRQQIVAGPQQSMSHCYDEGRNGRLRDQGGIGCSFHAVDREGGKADSVG